MHMLVTGAAGFIGSNLVDRLLELGYQVTGVDNLSTGQIEFLGTAIRNNKFQFITYDLFKQQGLEIYMKDVDTIFHLAANADVRFGSNHPRKDLEQNTIVTHNVLEAMRISGVRKIVFSSTGSVYGDTDTIPTPENAPFPLQTSLYGASKIASEGLISAYSQAFGIKSWIFRFVSILGERYTHGHVFDFYEQLVRDPIKLRVLGNGKQRKSYLYVQDCIDAIFLALENADNAINIFNLGAQDYCEVNQSIGWICDKLKVHPTLEFSGGDRGWVGDNPFIFLDTAKIRSLGWEPKVCIEKGILRTVEYLQHNEWVFKARMGR